MKSKFRRYDLRKRVIDIGVSSVGLIVTAPAQLVVAAFVWKDLGRPVLFKQERPGKNGEIFELIKFRSMKDIDESKGLVTNEQRITKFGEIIRSLSIDELPSLLNILRGEMSLIGPRPLRVEYLSRYSTEQARRHEIRPGLTGLAQVSGRNALDWEERFLLDVHYVDNRSLLLDLKIIFKTFAKVLQRDGISSEGHTGSKPFFGTGVEGEQV